ncbi:hypothetical protein ACBY01_11685 [Sphingomonas sp. ac-8]|uniref:hypothetical protein n=1 Tax=Sphingomonas sp. ac-8 TaxID=3242977 RepID=UPI003A802409
MMPVAGQRILLIGIGFYDYEAAIAAEFRALGAEVRVENEQPPELRGWLAPLRRRVKSDDGAATSRHLHAMRERARTIGKLDHVVVIKGTRLDEAFLRGLRADNPGVRLTAYHWDSMARFPELLRRQALFDRVLTFDHADAAANPDFVLRPLFFRPELAVPASATTIDISFVGWLHHDRLRQVEQVRAQADTLRLTSDFYLSTGGWTATKLRLKRRGQGVHSRAQPFDRYVATSLASRGILDLPHPQQTGLTMRAIEAIGAGRKLITTGVDIRRYDFYQPENIAIIDPVVPQLDPAFLGAPMALVDPAIIERYSLRGWALDVLGVTEPTSFMRDPLPTT